MPNSNLSHRLKKILTELEGCQDAADRVLLRETLLLLRDSLRERDELALNKSSSDDTRRLTEYLAFALKAGKSGTFDWDMTTNRNTWSPELLDLYGLPADEFGGRYEDWIACLVPEDQPLGAEAAERALSTGDFACTFRIRRRDTGEVRWMEGRANVLFDDAGKPARMVGINMDVTDLKQSQLAAAELQRKLDAALIAGEVGTFEWDVTENRVWGDRNFARFFGIPVNAPGGGPIASFLESIHPDDRPRVVAAIERTLETGCDFESEYRIVRGGETRWVIARGKGERDATGRVVRFPGVVLDITARKKAEEALRRSEFQRRLALESAELGSWHVDVATMTLTTDARFRAIFGVVGDEIDYEPAVAMIYSEDQARVRDAVAAATRPVDPEPYAVEYRIVLPDGSIRWVFAKGRANYGGADLQVVSFDGTLADVTERKLVEAEIKSARDAAEAASKAKDQFLAVLSHELRTPLTPALVTAQMLSEDGSLSPEHREMMRVIRRNIELEARLIDDMLDLTRIARNKLTLHLTTVNAHEKIQEVAAICAEEIAAKRLSVSLQLHAKKHHIHADVTRFQQIVWNLVKNAVKFTPPEGRLTVRTADTADGLVIEVVDTGMGIEPVGLTRIFNAFEQGGWEVTREFGGLGLGLAISKALVELHGGKIAASSEGTGKGATFTVVLPTAVGNTTNAWQGPGAAGKLTCAILLVEDHADTRTVMARFLRTQGCTVVMAGTAEEAIRMLAEARPDLIISDIGLPGLSGIEFMRRVKMTHTVKAIALSGYGMEDDVTTAREAGFDVHLTKPVNLQALEEAIHRLTARS